MDIDEAVEKFEEPGSKGYPIGFLIGHLIGHIIAFLLLYKFVFNSYPWFVTLFFTILVYSYSCLIWYSIIDMVCEVKKT